MSSAPPTPNYRNILKELSAFQSSMYDKASTYTKVIIGLGYGGFFAAWSGTKPHLSPRALVCSALFVTVSLVLYILFEILQTLIVSYLSIEFARTVDQPGTDVIALETALERYRSKARKLTRPLFSIWKIVFPATVLTGLVGAGILIYSFVRSLVQMWASASHP